MDAKIIAGAICAVVAAGCDTPGKYQNATYYGIPYSPPPTFAPPPAQQVVAQPVVQPAVAQPAVAQPVAVEASQSTVGAGYARRLEEMKRAREEADMEAGRQQIEARERRINDFLWDHDVAGIASTRNMLKSAIASGEPKLEKLASDIRLAGRDPGTDEYYIATRAKLARLKADLESLDSHVMELVVKYSAGAAASSMELSEAEKAERAAAIENLRSAGEKYRAEVESILSSQDW